MAKISCMICKREREAITNDEIESIIDLVDLCDDCYQKEYNTPRKEVIWKET